MLTHQNAKWYCADRSSWMAHADDEKVYAAMKKYRETTENAFWIGLVKKDGIPVWEKNNQEFVFEKEDKWSRQNESWLCFVMTASDKQKVINDKPCESMSKRVLCQKKICKYTYLFRVPNRIIFIRLTG